MRGSRVGRGQNTPRQNLNFFKLHYKIELPKNIPWNTYPLEKQGENSGSVHDK